ncbi:type II/IV secretion system ATPase subunit [Methanocella conradii]|uniref:type II/IV secretion system ATPase subunit n=1 Tax=Methanocella conradii TaxID=1175444 RepID=UPI00157E1AB5|nr:type II/IV secretion system ATPase subunit [Methanocella conradii]
MMEVNLPFSINTLQENHDHSSMRGCSTYNSLDAMMKREVEKNPFLLDYLHLIPQNTIGLPQLYIKLDRKLGDIKFPNIIYPIGDSIYAHIYPDIVDVRNYYIPIEPSLVTNIKSYLQIIEEKLVDMVSAYDPKTQEERQKILKECLRELCIIGNGHDTSGKLNSKNGNKGFKSLFSIFVNNNGKNDKIYLKQSEFNALEYLILRDKIGMGLLEPLISDPHIEDITCDGYGPIFLEHKIFKGLKTTIVFTKDDLNKFVLQLSERIGKPITYANPIIDSTLPDGSRINIVYGEDISKRGSNFTIRKFNAKPLSIPNLVASNTMDYAMAAYLWIMIQEGMSIFVSGETASGKTTTLNAIMAFISANSKIVSIEDTAEVQVPHKNWTREITRSTNKGDDSADVGMFDLLKAALRQRPNYIIVGEIRGIEGAIAFQAIQTGHPVMSTFHAASVEKLIQRLTGDPINVPKTYVDNLNLVIIQSAVRRPDGKVVRRVLSINEIVGYNPETKGFNYIEAFTWDPVTDKFVFRANKSSYLLEQKIGRRLGIPQNKIQVVYDEIEKRKKILKKISESGVTDYDEFFQTITKVEKKGLLKIEV